LPDVVSREADDPNAFGREPIAAALIAFPLVVVDRSVNFHRELAGSTVEIEDVGTNRVLAAEMEAEFVPPQHRPESALWLRHCAAHRPGALADEIG
jgi:hypothetical protein